MSDMQRLVRVAANVWPDEASGEYAATVDEISAAAQRVVEAVLSALRTPSEDAAKAGGLAATQATMSFLPPAHCGLAAMRGAIDHILSDDQP